VLVGDAALDLAGRCIYIEKDTVVVSTGSGSA
jgi:hypothetical protein